MNCRDLKFEIYTDLINEGSILDTWILIYNTSHTGNLLVIRVRREMVNLYFMIGGLPVCLVTLAYFGCFFHFSLHACMVARAGRIMFRQIAALCLYSDYLRKMLFVFTRKHHCCGVYFLVALRSEACGCV